MAQQDFVSIYKERGFLHQCTDEAALSTLLSKEKIVAYIGFDCTAPTLHVGSLVQIMILRWLQKCGHKPIVLLGGGTTRVGDPSGKDEARKLLDDAAIEENKRGIKQLFSKFIQFGNGKTDAVLVDNADWLCGLKYIEFLRDIGRHFSVNRMLTMESVKLRLEREQNLSFLEFNYMLLQAYDFLKLCEEQGCRVQIGGSDQWGNIVSGVDLTRRVAGKEVFGLTTPLITTSSGAKMGKTAQGAVWLTEEHLKPYDYWQFWRNTEDADVGRFLCLFTELPLEEIKHLESLEGAEINQAKIVLANEATALCHGREAAQAAEKTARKTFEEGTLGDALPVVEVSRAELAEGIPFYKLLHRAGLVASGGEAKRLIQGGGGKINDVAITDPNAIIGIKHLGGEESKLSAGKKKHALLKVVG